MAETIQPASITQETRDRYLIYALSVITARALPDARDGLKPVQRRILYTMYHDLHLHADGRPRKCAKIVGDVTGNYHPHGDDAVYDALVRLAQDFVLRRPLVDGQGNFGSVDGDAPAARRYTEAKLTGLADYLMSEMRQATVDMRDNYEGTRQEPVVLPARFPNLLVNGSSGIAVGLATNMPPHNLAEVIKACIHLIDDPEASTAELLNRLKGPDFPLAGKVVTDRTTLRKIYEEGTGSIKVQGEWKREEVGKREQIVITSIPYGVNKGSLEAAIGEIIAGRQLPQLTNLTNESSQKEGMRIVLELKPGSDPDVVMAYLYKHTSLQENFAYNMTCLVPGPGGQLRPERLGLKDILRHFLDFRLETVRRRFRYELEQLRRRIHILEGFRVIFKALDKAIRMIRESDGKADAAEKLIKAFKLDEVQAEAVLDAQLYRIAQLEIKKILDELKEKTAEAQRIEAILRSEKKLWGIIKNELNEVAEKEGDRRRTRIASEEDTPEFDPEAYIIRENTNVVLTRDGWIKRVGRLASIEGTRVREGDEVIAVAPGSTLDHAIFFADDGTAYTMRMNEVPASSGYGEPLAKFFRLGDQVRLLGCLSTDERFTPPDEAATNGEPPGPYLLVVTAQGQTLQTPLAPYRTASNKLGRRYVRLNDGDRVVLATLVRDEESMFLASAAGHVIHFPVEQINILSGAGKGVMGIKLAEDDTCLGGALINSRFDAMVVETAGGKTMEFRRGKYELTSRGGKGFEAVKRTTFVRVLPPPSELVDWEQVEGKGDGNGKGPNQSGGQTPLFD
jgi:DNA gyrase subunit A